MMGNGNTTCQSKTQRTIPSKHLLDEQNRLAAAKSSEIYRSPIKKPSLDNKTYRSINSGPSSYESGKASSLMTASGPSSIDSAKLSYSRTSGHSSIESHSSNGTQQHHSPSRMNGSPKAVTKHYVKSRLSTDTLNRVKTTTPNTSPSHQAVYGKPPRSGGCTTMPGSNSNSSITLQVTTSNESHIPSTKIFVQNSPVRSVITLENGQLTENSNVVIINNETTTNAKGELIKRTISKQGSPTRLVTRWDQDRQQSSYSETEAAYETGDSLSLISETSPDSSLVMPNMGQHTQDILENSKFTKNVNNDATMNNSRKLSLQIAHPGNNIVYKNCLKEAATTPTAEVAPTLTTSAKSAQPQSPIVSSQNESSFYDRISGSTSNLRFFEKNEKKLNSNCDLKALQQFETPALLAKLNSNPAINSDSLAHILHKNIITVGSEPNLAMNECHNRKLNRMPSDAKQVNKVPMDRRFSVSTTADSKDMSGSPSGEEIFTFPSLSDLSFNFTSLAAQKILQGVSLNSIDTLVELNMAHQEKQQNIVGSGTSATPTTSSAVPPAIRTDYGLV